MPEYSLDNLSYADYHAIINVTREHVDLHGRRLKGIVAFGDMVATGRSNDLFVLEVVEGWVGPRRMEFTSTSDVPLRGKLIIFFVLPRELLRPGSVALPGLGLSSGELLDHVTRAYIVLYSYPVDYLREALRKIEEAQLLSPPVEA